MTRFVDTNILLYAMLPAGAEGGKREVARTILAAGGFAVSAQVLLEFYTQATRDNRADALGAAEGRLIVERLCRMPVQALTAEIVLAAIATHVRFQVSYWDAAIIEAARVLRCDTLLTEDLNDGQDYAGVRVENPFAGL